MLYILVARILGNKIVEYPLGQKTYKLGENVFTVVHVNNKSTNITDSNRHAPNNCVKYRFTIISKNVI